MTDVVSVHVGQAGVQGALPLWELYCHEQNVPLDGTSKEGFESSRDGAYFVHKFTKLSPRAVLVDLDATSIDGIRNTSTGKVLFSPEFCIKGDDDAGSLFPKGFMSHGSYRVALSAVEKMRKLCEPIDNFHGFNFQHALGGGTGSGLSSLLLNKMSDRFRKKPIIQFMVYPSDKMSTSVVEPYNTILATAMTDEANKCSCIVDNEGLYRALQYQADFRSPDLRDINWLWAYAISGVTANIRHGGPLCCRLSDICTNMVPYPSVRYPMMTYSPVLGKVGARLNFTAAELVKNCFHPDKQLLQVRVGDGTYTSCCLLFRGEGSPHEINDSLKELKSSGSIPLTDWSPCGMKVSICPNPAPEIPSSIMRQTSASASALLSSTAVSQAWIKIHKKYKILLSKKSFLHWFMAEGMDYDQFLEADEYVCCMIQRYNEVV